MTKGSPEPPENLAAYVVEPLQRQSSEQLEDVIRYARELREYKIELQEQPVDPDEIDSSSDVVDTEQTSEGTIVVKRQKCGANCTCNDGKGHGPYKWLVTPDGSGGQNWEFKGKASDAD